MQVLDLTTPEASLTPFLSLLTRTLTTLDADMGLSLSVGATSGSFGHGPCRLTQVVIGWRPLGASITRAEIHTCAYLLAIAYELPLLDFALEPHGLGEMSTFQAEQVMGPRAVFGRVDYASEAAKTRQSGALYREQNGQS